MTDAALARELADLFESHGSHGLSRDQEMEIIRLLRAWPEPDKDAERLDWLDRDDIELSPCVRMDKPIVLIFHRKSGRLIGEGLDIRAAIDAAMTASQQEER